MNDLTPHRELILSSLEFTRQRFAEYPHYPNERVRQERLADVRAAIAAVQRSVPTVRQLEAS
jgi:hypothetical protein